MVSLHTGSPHPQNPQGPSCWLPAHQEEISYGKAESLTQNSLSPLRGGSEAASPFSSARVTRKCSLGSTTRFAAWDLTHLPLLGRESPAQALHRVLLNHGVGCSAAPLTHTGCQPSPASRNVSGQIGYKPRFHSTTWLVEVWRSGGQTEIMLPFWVRASKEILGGEEGLGPVWQLSDRWASELGKEAEGTSQYQAFWEQRPTCCAPSASIL